MKQTKKTKQGDVEFLRMREIMPTKEDFFLWEFSCVGNFSPDSKVIIMLSGDRDIFLKFWIDKEGNGKPTIINTGLKWKTFNMDGNILIMIKDPSYLGMPYTVFFTKKYKDI